MTRRRSSLHLAAKPLGDSAPKQAIETISEELAPTEEGRNSIVMEDIVEEVTHKTNCVEQSIEISAVQSEVSHIADKRGTLYAYESMDISAPGRRSVATSSSMLSYAIHGGNASPALSNVTTQTSNSTIEEPLTPVFSSTRLPSAKSTGNRRRTLFNLDMSVVNENIERMNESHRRSLAMANEAELGECHELPVVAVEPKPVTETKTPSNEPKRRRLFNPNDEVVISPPRSNRKNRLSITGSTGSVKRRRSLAVIPMSAAVKTSEAPVPVPIAANKAVVISEAPAPIAANKADTTSEAPAPIADNKAVTALPEVEDSDDNFVTPEPSVNIATVEKAKSPPTSATKPKGKRPRPIRTLVHTNMHPEQVQVIYKVGSTAQ